MQTPAPAVVHPYDSRWPLLFQEEGDRIGGAVLGLALAIEHVGSTAVPALCAKPIVDIMMGVRSLEDANHCIEPLGRIGYQYRPESEASIPERRYFAGRPRGGVGYHLHVVEYGGDFWERHLLFRDFLRQDSEAAEEYGRLKIKLAARFGTDREGYTEAKTTFVRSVAQRSRQEAEAACRKTPLSQSG